MFYTMINARAKVNYKGPTLTKDNYEECWFPAWFGAAKEIRDEFLEEGLVNSAKEIEDIIRESGHLTKVDVSCYL